MLRLALRELISRRTASLVAALGLLTATLGFIALASTSKTAEAVLTGSIGNAWQTPYDLLVRPSGSSSELETKDGLVRPNFLTGLNGGISIVQLGEIRKIVGVQVAAPIAMVGFIQWPGQLTVELGPASTAPVTVFRVSTTADGSGGQSSYPLQDQYVIVAPHGVITNNSPSSVTMSAGSHTITCDGLGIVCAAPTVCSISDLPNGRGEQQECSAVSPADLTKTTLSFDEPLMIAGIDPAAEAALDGLNHCVVSGRYLNDSDTVPASSQPTADAPSTLPILVSNRTFLDETLHLSISRTSAASSVLTGAAPTSLGGWNSVGGEVITAQNLYQDFLNRALQFYDTSAVISTGDVTYQVLGNGHLAAQTQPADLGAYVNNAYTQAPVAGEQAAPIEAHDDWFRSLTAHLPSAQYIHRWSAVGQYDPTCLPSFSPLAGGRMDVFAPPTVRLPDGRTMGPTRNEAGYVNSPPLLLTTLSGAEYFADKSRYSGAPGDKFISAIRVKVSGTTIPGAVSEARLSRAAAEIHAQTGLDVDIVKGSSPKTINVFLPAGKFGQPAVTVSEGWSVKGVAFRFQEAIQGQNLALFVLVLVGAMILVGQTSYTSVRRRRREFGMLRAIGWPARRVSWLVEAQMLLLGLMVGLIALGCGFGMSQALHLGTQTWQWLLAVPLAVAVAGLAAVAPAIAASRGSTVAVMAGGGRVRRSRVPRSALALGLRELFGAWRGEAVLGLVAVGIGSGLLGAVVLVAGTFRGQLDTTVLGTYLSAEVQPFHAVLAAIALAIGALAAAEIVTLSYLERQPGLAALRALGWPRLMVVQVVAGQALAFGIVGGLAGGLLVVVGGLAVGASGAAVLVAGGSALGAALVATGLAVVVPLALAYRLLPAGALRGE